MKITYHVEGGFAHFPGLAKPRTVDVDALPAARAKALRQLAEDALDAGKPAAAHSPRGADIRTYVITIESARGEVTASVLETTDDPAWSALIGKLREIDP